MAGADDANERLTPTSSDEAVKWVPAVFDTPGGGAGGAASHRRPSGTIYMDVAKTGLQSFLVNPEVFFLTSRTSSYFISQHQPTSIYGLLITKLESQHGVLDGHGISPADPPFHRHPHQERRGPQLWKITHSSVPEPSSSLWKRLPGRLGVDLPILKGVSFP